ncbi:hypothetical protein MHLP_00750 [Candidatus Mycoplasma haematolamae str. Purdue]|uniref:Uncharacterized protein n=1 Tax=Mycoplasma haematolamae (strain Purdue) TaxID=1212765 RepID=I7B902_MYCHA|nr:hypothetical protein [Candidatus Mycoplasma haematolamae]AFO51730.1 hypothetical protein MHLP_00750 [Candidatus Mycoplasma haematolamae str. Purdue]
MGIYIDYYEICPRCGCESDLCSGCGYQVNEESSTGFICPCEGDHPMTCPDCGVDCYPEDEVEAYRDFQEALEEFFNKKRSLPQTDLKKLGLEVLAHLSNFNEKILTKEEVQKIESIRSLTSALPS